MKKEYQDYLISKHPHFFGDETIYTGGLQEFGDLLKESKTKKIFPIQFGMECGDGWFPLIKKLFEEIDHRLKWRNAQLNTNDTPIVFSLTQVKEKFGGLNIYYFGGDEEISGMITLAESLSYSICETCGTMDNVGHTVGWIATICSSCLEKTDRLNNLEWKKTDIP